MGKFLHNLFCFCRCDSGDYDLASNLSCDQVGSYKWTDNSKIGVGAFGSVYLAKHERDLSKQAAIKVIRTENLSSKLRFAEEAKLMTAVKDHTYLVQTFDLKISDNHVYIVMEYCNGGHLGQFVREHGPLDESTTLYFLRQIAEALYALQSSNIIHRDIKPQNILLNYDALKRPPNDYTLKLCDFGLSRFLAKGERTCTIAGTLRYMAPEVIQGKSYDEKVDIWSVGVVAYECLTRRTFMGGKQLKELNDDKQIKPIIKKLTISKEFYVLMKNLLRVKPSDRISIRSFRKSDCFKQSSDQQPSTSKKSRKMSRQKSSGSKGDGSLSNLSNSN